MVQLTVRWRDHPVGLNMITCSLKTELFPTGSKRGGSQRDSSAIAGLEGGGGQKPRNAGSLQKLRMMLADSQQGSRDFSPTTVCTSSANTLDKLGSGSFPGLQVTVHAGPHLGSGLVVHSDI